MFEKKLSELSYKDITDLLYLRKEQESEILDYKRIVHTSTDEFAKDVTGFANTKGGYIIYGIDEKQNEIIGVENAKGRTKVEEFVQSVINHKVDKAVFCEIVQIEIPQEGTDTKHIVVLYVKESDDKPVFANDVCYVRKGSSVFKAKPNEIKKMYEDSFISRGESNSVSVQQDIKGKGNVQVGINSGTIIKTDRIIHKNEVHANPDIHISELQARKIHDKVDEIVDIYEKAGKLKSTIDKGKIFSKVWNSLKKKFGVTSYKLLGKEQFDEVMGWLQKQIVRNQPKLRRTNKDAWRNKHYASIYAKSNNELGMTKEDLYSFVNEKLELKKPISSLKELTDTQLTKVYQLVHRKK